MSRQGKSRAATAKAAGFSGSPAFGSFSTSSSNLSYVSEPPNLSAVSDANVVVSLKNLLKKDGTTKSKALEDLVSYARAHPYEQDGGAEEAVLEAWVHLYPRVSIDDSRRVRELSHTLQLELMKSARRRMERRLPRIVGAWLAGAFDRDRVVSRAAADGLSTFLATDEKTVQFWRKCELQILEYATDAIRETPDSLSDERSTTKDDAEAKYYRVMGGSLSLVLNLLQKVGIERVREQVEEFLSEGATWALAAAEDPFVRRAVYQLCQVCLCEHPDLVPPQLPRIGKALISDALRCRQTGSAADLVSVLTTLSRKHPEVWGTKKQLLPRLQPLVERGSQGSHWVFWRDLSLLIAVLPQKDVSPDVATAFLKAMRVGISSREEPRAYLPHSCSCYLTTLTHLESLVPSDMRAQLLQDNFFPLTSQYLHPEPDQSSWTVSGQHQLLASAWVGMASHADPSVGQSVVAEWGRLADALVSRMANSLPGSSKDFTKSQQTIADEGNRWFTLIGAILGCMIEGEGPGEGAESFRQPIFSASVKVLRAASDLLLRRNFKPFGAAATVQAALASSPDLFRVSNGDILASVVPTERPEELETMLESPSATLILSSVNLLGDIPEQHDAYEKTWTAIVRFLTRSESLESAKAVALLVSGEASRHLAQKDASLQAYVVENCFQVAKGDTESWELFETALAFGVLEDSNIQALTSKIVQILGRSQQPQETVMRSLEVIMRRAPSALSHSASLHVELVTKLLSLTETSSQDIAQRAVSLRRLLDTLDVQPDGKQQLIGIIQEQLDSAGPRSLEITTLVQQATSVLASKSASLEQLLPNTNLWMEELSLLLRDPPDPVLSLTSDLAGAYFLVKGLPTPSVPRPRRDPQGRSIPARMALYTTQVLCAGSDLSPLPHQLKLELLYLLYLVVEIASDQLTLTEGGKLWATVSGDAADSMEGLITSARTILRDQVINSRSPESGTGSGESPADDLIGIMLQQANNLSPMAMYSAKAMKDLLQAVREDRGVVARIEQKSVDLGVMKATPTTILSAAALVTGFGETLASSKIINRLCNVLISDITGAFPTSEKALLSMVLLNACISVYGMGELPVENRRLVFAVRQITTWTDTPDEVDSRLAAEACKALRCLFPHVESVYGPYWEQAIEYCIHLWSKASQDPVGARLPCLHASLKLLSTLESMAGANDDLDEALSTHAEGISSALLGLLKMPRDAGGEPAGIVDGLLCRRVAKVPLEHVKDLSELYGLVASESREIQTAAFELLDRALPAAQEQTSFDVVLEKRAGQLPDELLSLLLEPPTLESYPDDELAQFPTAVRSYLLTWLLIFDTYQAAAFKLRSDYTENLKASGSVPPFMEFMFDVLGHSAAHALNLDRERFTAEHISRYDLKVADSETGERSMQWLLIHLFYRVLKYVPGLFKAWFLDCRSKQTKMVVEAWMSGHFSPLVASDALDEVSEWASKQEPADGDEKELVVKVAKAAREVMAGYEVDELQASIAIRLPTAYPLEPVTVVGVNRVGANEKKWQSWLMSTQGVITFSNGSIIEGLNTFRRNIVGALKGQTECAICYSIVSPDKRMPDKKCKTCRNLFHRQCLFKWFQTSNQNTCPLCRNPVDYLGADAKARRGG